VTSLGWRVGEEDEAREEGMVRWDVWFRCRGEIVDALNV
jgi:hypothetical protein